MRHWFSRTARPPRRRHAPFLALALAVIAATAAYGVMINAGWLT
jgi:hypothetical protein